jgi:hypothetical protein
VARLARLIQLLRSRVRLVALAGFVMGTIGSCGLPQIKPPGLP